MEFSTAVKINVTHYQDGFSAQTYCSLKKSRLQRVSCYLLIRKSMYKYYVLLMDTFPGSKCLKSRMGMIPAERDRGKGAI